MEVIKIYIALHSLCRLHYWLYAASCYVSFFIYLVYLIIDYGIKDDFSMLTRSFSFECGSAFGQLLDDLPLSKGEISSSVLAATAFHAAGSGEKAVSGDSSTPEEAEKGLLLLIASDTPGLQVYVAFNLFHILVRKEIVG